MDKFAWTDEYSVGIKLIDEQHKRFFEIAGSIMEFTKRGESADRNELLKLVTELADHALQHLETEEEYFDKYDYDGAKSHIESHNAYRRRTKEFVDAATREGADVPKIAAEVADYASQWLTRHILLADKQYTKFFREKGVE